MNTYRLYGSVGKTQFATGNPVPVLVDPANFFRSGPFRPKGVIYKSEPVQSSEYILSGSRFGINKELNPRV